jgi:hypothetical protein
VARQVTIENEDDFKLLKRYIEQWAVRARENVGAYTEYVEPFERLLNNFEDAVVLKNPSEKIEVPAEKQPAHKWNYCPDHPTYGAIRSPRTDCETCWRAYKKMNPNIQTRKINKL